MCLAIPGKVLNVAGDDPITRGGKVSFGGTLVDVSLAYTPEASIGDYVIVHVGFAISRLDEDEARKTLDYLKQIGELEEAVPPGSGARPAE